MDYVTIPYDEYLNNMNEYIHRKCSEPRHGYTSCEEAADFYIRRCMTDGIEEDKCREEVFEILKGFCQIDNNINGSTCVKLMTTKRPSTTTPAPSTTTDPEVFKKLTKVSHVITVGTIAGILLLFAIVLLIFTRCRRRRQMKREEAEAAAWHIPGWSSGTTSEESKSTSSVEGGTQGFGSTSPASGVETAKEKTNLKTAMSGETKKEKSKKNAKKGKAAASVPTGTPVSPVVPVTPASHAPPIAPVASAKPVAPSTPVSPATPKTPVTPVMKEKVAAPEQNVPVHGTPATFASPATHVSPAPAPSAPPAPPAPKSGFTGSAAIFGGAPKTSQHAPSLAPSPGEHVSTGETAIRMPLVWNKQADANVYY